MANGFLDKQRAIAGPGFNRWMVPPAALAIHLSIGQVYAYSVFKIPLTRAIGITHSAPGDWRQEQIVYMFSIAIGVLGLSAAAFGGWLERNGPRKAMFYAACCFGAGFLVAALGVYVHRLWLVFLGYGVIGGIGLGLGYLSPVATLIRWFPDRPGMATGLAIMGFGGGGMIGSALALFLMQHFRSPTSVGAWQAMVAMGLLYFAFMMFGVFTVRTPPPGWRPAGWTPPAKSSAMIAIGHVRARTALRVPQFYLLWLVLCANTTAGIGILEQASPMIQEMFRGRVLEVAAGGFVGLLSLFNLLGRFFWSSTSDYIGRKPTFMTFFLLGIALYVIVPFAGASHLNSVVLFVLLCGVIISMYGGGFATMPAYLKDLFGTREVSVIYGGVLTAWSAAGILGPLLVNYIRRYQLGRGVPPADAYSTVLFVMAGLLFVGLICNALVRPLSAEHYEVDDVAAPPAPSAAPRAAIGGAT